MILDSRSETDKNRIYSEGQIKKFVPYQKIMAQRAKLAARQERKLEELQLDGVDNLLKHISLLQNYRKKLEYNIANDPNIAHKKDLINADYNILEQQTQQKIDKLKADIVSLGEFYQEQKARLDIQRQEIEQSRNSRSQKSFKRDYLYKENKKLLQKQEESLAQAMSFQVV